MRFRLDGQDGGIGQPSQPEPKNKPSTLSRRQCVEFLRLVHEGMGRTMACTQLGIGIATLKRTLGRRSNFRKALEQIEQVRADNLYSVLYEAALRGDTRAAQFLLGRHDRTVARRQARRDASVDL